jgi:extracellular factor (EF) 3-hydroxypalmitic acid methyl ester biosynthesis protein
MFINHPTLQEPINFLQQVIANGGPETKQYDSLNEVFNTLAVEYKSGRLTPDALHLLQEGFGDECMQHTLHGHIKSKPYGYAGDFMIIDKIYREQLTEDDRFVKWDIFWNKHAAAKAVRNRKDYFKATVLEQLNQKGTLKLLDVASGPARDVHEIYAIIQPEQLHTVCIDMDKHAIDYAKNLNTSHSQRIEFIHQNIFRFQTEETFDLVWSAGLFDYFNDALFVKILRKFLQWTSKGGEVVIGNFSTQNPSRNYMELIGDWFLQHRSKEDLFQLAQAAGAPKANIHIDAEMEGVNLFLHVRK